VIWDVWSRNSVVSIATRYGLHGPGLKPRWWQEFPSRPAPRPTQTPIQWATGLFTGCKTTDVWRWSPTLSSAEFKERVELYLYALSLCLHGMVQGEFYHHPERHHTSRIKRKRMRHWYLARSKALVVTDSQRCIQLETLVRGFMTVCALSTVNYSSTYQPLNQTAFPGRYIYTVILPQVCLCPAT